MYHSVSAWGERDDLTVDKDQLEAHFNSLHKGRYNTILMSELIAFVEGRAALPEKPVLITFDDGFKNNFDIAYPLARRYGIRLNFFVVPSFIQRGEYRGSPIMTADDIRSLHPSWVEIGLHSFEHQSYNQMTPVKMGQDIDDTMAALREMGIPCQPVLAYPFGAYPKRPGHNRDRLFELLEEKGIKLAFRIGNRINTLPLKNRYTIQRMDITGRDSLALFEWSLRYGKKRVRWVKSLLRSGNRA